MIDEAEVARIEALARLEVLDTAPEPEFDDLARLAALTFNTPVAYISLIDTDRQWFKARVGIDFEQTPRDIAFCDHTIRSNAVMVVPDAMADDRFRDSPLVTGERGVRFYAGAPLITPDGHRIGTLCVADFEPRTSFNNDSALRLSAMAQSVSRVLAQRAMAHQSDRQVQAADAAMRESEARLRSLNWALTAYARSSSALLHRAGLESVVNSFCEAIVADEAYILASIWLVEPPPGKSLRPVAAAGRARGYHEGLKLSWSEDVPEGRGPTGMAIRSGRPHIMRDSLVDPAFGPWREMGLKFGIRSSVTVPFFKADAPAGVLLVYASRPDAFGPRELQLFQQMADELAFSMALEEDRARFAASEQARRAAEEAEINALRRLRDSEEHFRLLAENSRDLIVRYDIEGRIEYVSPSVRQLGYEPDEVVGRTVQSFAPSPDLAAGAFTLRALKAGLPLPKGRRNEWPLVRKDGQLVWMQGNPSPIHDEAGNPIGVTSVMRDITELRAIEQELRRKREEAEAAAIVKAQFLANMSHEIRTPLTGVLGFAGLLERVEGLPDLARTYVSRITAGGQALLSIVNEVLEFSRLEAGKLELDPHPFDLEPFLRETVGLTQADAGRKGLALGLEIQGVLPEAISADSGRLRQVLLNLLSNAIKFTATGSVTVTVNHQAGVLRVVVRDTGRGLSAENIDRLFQRFSQVDGSSTREHGGAGLGLAISRGLVEMMGGAIGVESVEGQGAAFWFTIAAPVVARGEPKVAVEGEAWTGGPLKILVVDDVAVNRELIAAMLAPFDLELSEASNGAEAVEAAMRAPFDLILMDLQMPGMDGLAATKSIRANSDLNRETPILAVSANVMPAQVEACRQAGMNDHIGKPLDPKDLLGKIAAWTE